MKVRNRKVKNSNLFQVDTKKKQTKSISYLCLLLFGIYGVLFFLSAIKEISFAGGWIGIAAFLVCLGNWYLYTHRRKLFWCVSLVGIGGIGWLSYLLREILWEQVQCVIEMLQTVGEIERVDLTLLIFILTLVLCYLLFFLEWSSIGHNGMILLTTVLLIVGAMFGILIKWQTLFLLILFQVIFYALHGLERKKRRTVILTIEQLSGRPKKVADAVSLSLAVLLGLLFGIALLIARVEKERIYHFTYNAEGYVYRTVVNALGLKDKPVKDGKISRSNNHPLQSEQMQVKSEQKPTEFLYLSGFYGEDYIGGDWTAADSQKIYEEVAGKLDLTYWENHLDMIYSGMYYILNSRIHGNNDPDPIQKSRNLWIVHTNQGDSTYYRPYYSQFYGDAWDPLSNHYDFIMGYGYSYYEQKDMEIDWQNAAPEFVETADFYRLLQTAYQEIAERLYTKVPEELVPRLTQLCSEQEFSELDEITAFILYTLHSNAVYTLTPGMAPYGEDILEYFLFENKRGYCVHFAATAALMYRMYGIPARYVSGYIVDPLDFEQQEDGSYLAKVTDQSAHAWVEIFVEDYGWMPVEVTPAAGFRTGNRGVMEEENRAGSKELEEIFLKYDWNFSLPSLERTEKAENVVKLVETDKRDPDLEANMGAGNFEKKGGWWIVLAEGLLLIPLVVRFRRFCRREKMERMGSRGIFLQILKVLRIGGYLLGYEGWEADFCTELERQIPEVDAGEIERMMEIVNQAAFGGQEEAAEDREYVRRVYWKIVGAVCQTARGWKRLVLWSL